MIPALVCLACLCVGAALGAAWRRAETRRWKAHAEWWKRHAKDGDALMSRVLFAAIPAHAPPMSCQLGSRSAVSERIEGAVRALCGRCPSRT
jgi:hypothetical protein